MNEETTPESSLDLTLTQHPCDEDLKPQEVCDHLKVDPLRTSYYDIFFEFLHPSDFVAS
jgi:hypothetical protein